MARMPMTLPSRPDPGFRPLTPALTLLFAAASGLCVANIYFAQPLIEPIARTLGMPPALAGLLMTLTQLGYGAGLLFVVPLSDVVENRRLVLWAMGFAVAGLAAAAAAPSAAAFLVASFAVGVGAVAAQVLLPLASHLAPEAMRGKVVGNVMAGLLTGIMLARPFSSFVAASFGWRAVFAISALLMAALTLVLARRLPRRRPEHIASYRRIIVSLAGIVVATPLLRYRAAYQGSLFAIFQAFWTAVPLALSAEYGLGQHAIAGFALAGAGGALTAPLAGRMADRGWSRPATGAAIALVLAASLGGGLAMQRHSIAGLLVVALVIDGAVQSCQVLSLRSLYMLAPELRGRLNALFLTFMFVCGAAGSGSAAALYTHHGWNAIGLLSAGLALVALAIHAAEQRFATRAAA